MGNGWTGRSDAYFRKLIHKDNDAVSLEVPDEENRMQFKKSMLAILDTIRA